MPGETVIDDHTSAESAGARAESGPARPPRKRILLFSDGTGNSSGKLNKTNVWRMYEAADFGVPRMPDEMLQIGRYDNGVGTTSFRPLAILQGIFGWGLVRNVLSLYLFLCQNYRKGDEICLFGFSRGAFTVRLLADLIDKEGIVPSRYGGAVPYLARDAYRHYRRHNAPVMPPMRWIVPAMKWLFLGLVNGYRRATGQICYANIKNQTFKPDIAFLGVWDTVSAYGGPIVELVRAFDNWILKISFSDTELPGCVTKARHALALDDERDSFQPIPWSEKGTDRERLLQVWFAGMHSDVGGGYPDPSLAYVPLCWMMDHAMAASIRLSSFYVALAQQERDAFGRLHDSRSGTGGYYRYQPRNIGGYMQPPEPGTEAMTDVHLSDQSGLSSPVLAHEAVFLRIALGTDGYAPITIPRDCQIVRDPSAAAPALSANMIKNLTDRGLQAARDRARSSVYDLVWARRIAYFAIVLISIVGAALPLWGRLLPVSENGGLAGLAALPFRALGAVLPALASPWITADLRHPFVAWGVGAAAFLLFLLSAGLERRLRRWSRVDWRRVIQGHKPGHRGGGFVFKLRTSRFYQEWLGTLKWYALPSVFGILLLAALASFILTLLVQLRLSSSSTDLLACRKSVTWFRTKDPCTMLPARVVRGRHYWMVLEVPVKDGWRDGNVATDPTGRAAGHLFWGGDLFAIGMRRELTAAWSQPLLFIVPDHGRVYTQAVRAHLLGRRGDRTIYAADVVAASTGQLGIGLNEAVAPWPLAADAFYGQTWYRYGGYRIPYNSGTACVDLWRLTEAPPLTTISRLHCGP